MPAVAAQSGDCSSSHSTSTIAADDASTAASAVPTTGMRRVASAPAFKHASAYQALSPAAAVAAAQAAAQAAADGTGLASSSCNTLHPRTSSREPRKWGQTGSVNGSSNNSRSACSSCFGGRCKCLEVYVVSRPFVEFGGDLIKKMPQEARDHMLDMGICHYMTVFRTPDGQFVQFDFGPQGGDVQKAHGPVASLLKRAHAAALAVQQPAAGQAAGVEFQHAISNGNSSSAVSNSGKGMVHSPSAPVLPLASLDLVGEAGEAAEAAMRGQACRQRPKKGVGGAIRERHLDELPVACMYMGRTQLTLDGIRRYNRAQGSLLYTLHDNDCRHYVNSLVQYATGVERSTQHLKRHYFNTRHADKWLWYGWFISATQFVTDVGNWSNVQAGAVVTLLAMTGRSTLAQLKTLTLPAMPAVTQALPSLIPSVRLAAGSGTAGSAIAGTLATTLKLPAAALLKRPLAGSAVAAAGGAGAAAAAIRTHPGAAANEATAAAASASSSNSSSNGAFGSVAMQGGAFRGLALWARPLKHWRDDVGKSLKGAMLSFRRASIGRRERLLEEQQQSQYEACLSNNAAAAGGIAARTVPNTRGWQWGRSAAARQQQLVHAGAAAVNGTGSTQLGHSAVMVLPATAVTGSVTAVTELQDSSSNARLQHQQQGLEQQLGRHVIWLGGNAARATRHATALAGRQVNQIVSRARGHTTVLPGAAAAGGVAYADNATSMLLPHRQQVQQQQRMGLGQRSKSAPNLVHEVQIHGCQLQRQHDTADKPAGKHRNWKQSRHSLSGVGL
eukprot:GHRR01004889.1.p1 GENE.GHRR01004889.1~~GHRR01004889.1.p1  ORF type:complete len:785 (+),score=318.55 GHRR01004889.1:460-2814(+)